MTQLSSRAEREGAELPWSYALREAGIVERIERPADVPSLLPGQIRLRFLAGGLCGSDMPLFAGHRSKTVVGPHESAPVHEVVGEVIGSASDRFAVGARVVGTSSAATGLSELLIESDETFIAVPDELGSIEAVAIQSIATVLRAAGTLPDVSGRRVAVLGAGPIGLAFLHVLRHRGAAWVTAIDPVARSAEALRYGADEYVQSTSSEWVAGLDSAARPELVIEAVGHQHHTIRDALFGVSDGGLVLAFGGALDSDYPLPVLEMYERGLTLRSGRTRTGWVEVLEAGRDYYLTHRGDFAGYISHALPVSQAQSAYRLYARPQESRLKVALQDIY